MWAKLPPGSAQEMKQNVALATTSEPREPERQVRSPPRTRRIFAAYTLNLAACALQALHELQEQVREALASGALLRERLRAVEAEIESGVADLCGAGACGLGGEVASGFAGQTHSSFPPRQRPTWAPLPGTTAISAREECSCMLSYPVPCAPPRARVQGAAPAAPSYRRCLDSGATATALSLRPG